MSKSMLSIKMNREIPAALSDGVIIEAEEADGYDVYVECDEITSWIGCCKTVEGLENIVSPENFIDSIYQSCSEAEILQLMPDLEYHNYQYDVFGDIRTAIHE